MPPHQRYVGFHLDMDKFDWHRLYPQTPDWTPALSQLASTVKDAFLVALEEHHDPVSGSSSIPLDGGKCKSKQVDVDMQKGK